MCGLVSMGSGCRGWRPDASVCLAGARLTASGTCRPQPSPPHALPFRPGYETEIMQGYHGYQTHKNELAYSLDFKCEPGTPIVASRDGVVWDVRDDSNRGCNDRSCIEDGNYVVLDHGDGSFTEYHHLQQFGALVEKDEQVCRGETIGLCGNTGYSSGPHLHFAITNAAHRTLPGRLPSESSRGFPVAIPDTRYTSHNELDVPCGRTEPSRLPRDAFAHYGVVLEATPLLSLEIGSSTRIRGRYHGDQAQVAIHRKPVEQGEWHDRCISVDDSGRFETTMRWPAETFEPGFYWFIITGADEECHAPGWSWSYKLQVRRETPPESGDANHSEASNADPRAEHPFFRPHSPFRTPLTQQTLRFRR